MQYCLVFLAIFMLVCVLQQALIWGLFLIFIKYRSKYLSQRIKVSQFHRKNQNNSAFSNICSFWVNVSQFYTKMFPGFSSVSETVFSNICEYSYEYFFWFSCSHIHVGLCFATGINLAPLSDICQRMLAMQFSAQNSVRWLELLR